MLHHWDMIDTKDHRRHPPGDFDITSIPLIFTILDTFQQSLVSFEGTLTGDFDKVCHDIIDSPLHQIYFCEAVKVDVSKTKE
jgi:hypothetical protein